MYFNWPVGEVVQHTCLSRMHSWVQIPYGSPEKSLELINKRGLEKDNHETNEILTKAYESLQRYKQFTKTEESLNNTVHFINCLNSQNDLYSIEDIFREVRNCLIK